MARFSVAGFPLASTTYRESQDRPHSILPGPVGPMLHDFVEDPLEPVAGIKPAAFNYESQTGYLGRARELSPCLTD